MPDTYGLINASIEIRVVMSNPNTMYHLYFFRNPKNHLKALMSNFLSFSLACTRQSRTSILSLQTAISIEIFVSQKVGRQKQKKRKNCRYLSENPFSWVFKSLFYSPFSELCSRQGLYVCFRYALYKHSIYLLFFQLEGMNKINMGNSSRRPASISNIRTNLLKCEKNPKFCVGPTSSSPGPILFNVATTAVKLVVKSFSSAPISRTEINNMAK